MTAPQGRRSPGKAGEPVAFVLASAHLDRRQRWWGWFRPCCRTSRKAGGWTLISSGNTWSECRADIQHLESAGDVAIMTRGHCPADPVKREDTSHLSGAAKVRPHDKRTALEKARVLLLHMEQPITKADLAALSGRCASTLDQQLALLEKAGLVRKRTRSGKRGQCFLWERSEGGVVS